MPIFAVCENLLPAFDDIEAGGLLLLGRIRKRHPRAGSGSNHRTENWGLSLIFYFFSETPFLCLALFSFALHLGVCFFALSWPVLFALTLPILPGWEQFSNNQAFM